MHECVHLLAVPSSSLQQPFVCTAMIDGKPHGTGEGPSKKAAKQVAGEERYCNVSSYHRGRHNVHRSLFCIVSYLATVNVKIFMVTIFCGLNFRRD